VPQFAPNTRLRHQDHLREHADAFLDAAALL
jgi:hypothetical protein